MPIFDFGNSRAKWMISQSVTAPCPFVQVLPVRTYPEIFTCTLLFLL